MKRKKLFTKLFTFFILAFFLNNSVNAADETTVEELIPNEFIGGGTAQGWNGDDAEWNYTLPFSFNFYGVDYTDIKIGSNGIICLDNTEDCTWYPDPDFTDTSGGEVIAPLGIDLRTDVNPSNDIYITENADNVVIRWDVTEYGATDQINFEVMLYSNGNIKFNYGDVDSGLLSEGAVVGITEGDGIVYTESVYNGNDDFHNIQTSAWGDFVPNVTTLSPTDNSFNVDLDSNLQITFDREIYKDTGNITIKKISDNSIVETIDINSVNITGWGTDTLTIDLSSDLEYFTEYYVNIDATAIKDIDDKYYNGISDDTTWNFTTQAINEIIETLPDCECYEIGSAEGSQPADTILEFSDDNRNTWTYTPVDDGTGKDCNVSDIKLIYTGDSNFVGEDLEAEFVGSTIDHTDIISEGNGKVVLDIEQIGTYTFGSANSDTGWGITTDDSGNIYRSGLFRGTIDFDFTNGIDNYTPSETTAIFITKHNADGSYGWTRIINTPQYATINGNVIATDSLGNVYMTGHFIGTTDFDNVGSGDIKTPSGSSDIFITKYSADGSYNWTKQIGGTGTVEISQDIVVNDAGDMFVTGYFYGIVDFDDTTGVDSHVASNGGSIFISKYNADGSYGWTRSAKGEDSVLKEGNGIAIDSFNNVYITGHIEGIIDLDGTAGVDNYTANGSSDIFITKYSADGSYNWSRVFGSPKTGNDSNDEGRSIVVNDSGEVFVSGVFHDTVDFDGTVGIDNLTASYLSSHFLTKYNSDGSYEWTIEVGGTSWYGSDIEIYNDGIILIEEGAGRTIRYDNSGNVVWTRLISSSVRGRGLTIHNGYIYTTGGFDSLRNFHTTGGTENYSSQGSYDIYVAKHNVDGDYGYFIDGYFSSGTYQTQINSTGSFKQWTQLTAIQETPTNTEISYEILDETCTTTLITQTTDTTIDLSGVDILNTALCLEITFETTDNSVTPKLDDWEVTYFTETTNTDDSIDYSTVSDPSCSFSNPSISIQKDDNDNHDDIQTINLGDEAEFLIIVENDGNVRWETISVTDPDDPDCSRNLNEIEQIIADKYGHSYLDEDETFEYTCVGKKTEESYTSNISVSASDGADINIVDEDQTNVIVENDVAVAICGNDIVEENEQCDDGNTKDDDGCSSKCEYEQFEEPKNINAQFIWETFSSDGGYGTDEQYNSIFTKGGLSLAESESFYIQNFQNNAYILVTWEDRAKGEFAYVIERKVNDGEFEKLDNLDKNTESYIDRDINPESSYTYRVYTKYSGDKGEKSKKVTVNIGTLQQEPITTIVQEIIEEPKKEKDELFPTPPDLKPIPAAQITEEQSKEPINYQKIAKNTVITAGVASGLYAFILSSLLAFPINPLTASTTSSIIRFLALPFGRKRKEYYQGIAFDAVTKQPVPNLPIQIIDTKSGLVKKTVVTNEEGRYGFLPEKGEYQLEINNPNYKLNTEQIRDELYEKIYQGQTITITKEEQKNTVISPNLSLIPPTNFNWKEFAKQKIQKRHSNFAKTMNKLSQILFIAGFIWSAISVALSPNVIWNWLILAFYIILSFYQLFNKKHQKRFGKVYKKESNKPIPFSRLNLKNKENQIKKFSVSDTLGRYLLLSPEGTYNLETKGTFLEGQPYTKKQIVKAKNGVVNAGVGV
ncbi:MAG: Ig-like domain-containing protein [Candidatus Moranbacteria bacterium]|nr:Ig-like domain-containing protein [Candidatus Moranbacteria bacterium]